jgi:hypothetical protein
MAGTLGVLFNNFQGPFAPRPVPVCAIHIAVPRQFRGTVTPNFLGRLFSARTLVGPLDNFIPSKAHTRCFDAVQTSRWMPQPFEAASSLH